MKSLAAIVFVFPPLSLGRCRFSPPTAPPIANTELASNRAIHVNGQPFFPIMAWLQDAANFPAARDCGMNTTAGYWTGSSGTKDVVEYQALVAQAGLYGVMPSSASEGHPQLLGYIHDDEPDLPQKSTTRTSFRPPTWRSTAARRCGRSSTA